LPPRRQRLRTGRCGCKSRRQVLGGLSASRAFGCLRSVLHQPTPADCGAGGAGNTPAAPRWPQRGAQSIPVAVCGQTGPRRFGPMEPGLQQRGSRVRGAVATFDVRRSPLTFISSTTRRLLIQPSLSRTTECWLWTRANILVTDKTCSTEFGV
jgi:hypothetical protein